MKKKELFEKTVGILVNAYRNDTLEHRNCLACAVGNIIAANCGINDIISSAEWEEKTGGFGSLDWTGWTKVFMTVGTKQSINMSAYKGVAKFQIDSTGYSWQDLAKIEYAFETTPRGNNDDDWMLNGLLAVYDVLCDIHEVNPTEVKAGEEVFVL